MAAGFDVCHRFLGGESLTCAEPHESPLAPQHRNSGPIPPDHLSSCASTLAGLRKAAAVILESQPKMVIHGNGVLRSLVATILLTVLMEMALIAFSIAMTP